MNKREIGTFYEEAVSEYLKLQGINIICKNFRCRSGEIDLIGWENDCLIFFEVKYRKDERYGYPVEAVTEMKKRTISEDTLHAIDTIRNLVAMLSVKYKEFEEGVMEL